MRKNSDAFLKAAGLSNISDINNTMQLRPPNGIPLVYKEGEPVMVEVLITDLDQPILQKTEESLIFYKFNPENCEWVKVEDATIRLNEQFIIQPDPTNSVITIGSTGMPVLDDIDEVTTLRVVRIGRLIDQSGKEIGMVAAYYDIEVEP